MFMGMVSSMVPAVRTAAEHYDGVIASGRDRPMWKTIWKPKSMTYIGEA